MFPGQEAVGGWREEGVGSLPGIRLFINRCVDEARRTGHAETILGRRRLIPELKSRNPGQVSFGERIAVNTIVQGSAADLIKPAMIDIHRESTGGSPSAKMLIQVHDELVFEVPRGDVEEEARMIRKMERAIPLDVPIVMDIAWGRIWTESKQSPHLKRERGDVNRAAGASPQTRFVTRLAPVALIESLLDLFTGSIVRRASW